MGCRQESPRDASGFDVPAFFCVVSWLLYNQKGCSIQSHSFDVRQICFHAYEMTRKEFWFVHTFRVSSVCRVRLLTCFLSLNSTAFI